VSTDNLLGGLSDMKVGDLNLTQVGAGSFVNISNTWNNVQIQAFQQSLQSNSKAMQTASSLNDMMSQRNLLPQNQRVVGYFGGKFYTMNANNAASGTANGSPSATNGAVQNGTSTQNGTTNPNATATQNGTANPNGTATQNGTGTAANNAATANSTNTNAANANTSMPTTNAMLDGLVNVNLTNITNIQAKNVINVNGSMSTAQIRSLAQSLNGNASARRNAEQLTRELRQRGLLDQNQSVMGFANGQVFAGRSPSAQNQGSGGTGSLPSDDDDTSTTSDKNRQPRER